jgi:two-component system response regulator NreC
MSTLGVTVLIADDHAVVRDGLRGVLSEGGIDVVGEACDGIEAVRQSEITHPQVVLMDISMPGLNGLDAARQIKCERPGTAVVFLTMHESDQYFLEALRCGAEGYVPKSAPAADVLEAVRSAAEGKVYIHPSVARFLLQTFLRSGAAPEGSPSDPYEMLTAREREVLGLVASGLTTAEIAERLYLSPNTVHRHRTSLMQKLGLHDRLELLRFCIKRGLVDATS